MDLTDLSFKFKEKIDPISYTCNLSINMSMFNREHYISGFLKFNMKEMN
jgi:hypothetical protein